LRAISPSPGPTDETLSFGEDSFTRIWHEHRMEILQLCRRCMKNDADAEEAFSRAGMLIYVKLAEHRHRIENLRAWLMRTAFNVCMSLHRENRRRAEQSLEELEPDSWNDPAPIRVSPGSDPERSYLRKEMSDFLWSSIAGLPDRLRETVLTHLALSSYREVADRLAINETNVRKRMQEARAILSRQLAQYRSGHAGAAPSQRRGAPPKPEERQEPGIAGIAPVRALRSATAVLPGGVRKEGLLALRHEPSKAPARRREALERYVEQHPRGWKRRQELARVLLEECRPDEAVAQLEHVVRQQPRQLEAWLDLISAYRFLERSEAAAEACDRALATAGNGAAAGLLQGLRAQALGQADEAERAFRRGCEELPESPAPRVALAEVQAAAGRPAEALDSLDAALAIAPDDVAALTLGAEALRLSGRSAEAVRRLERVLEIDPANPPALERWLAMRSRAAGGAIQRDEPWRQAEALSRERPASRGLLAYLRLRGGDLEGIEETALMVSRHCRFREAWVESARFLDALGYPHAALEELDAARRLHPAGRDLDLLACRLAARAGIASRMLHETEALLVRHGDAWDVASTAAWVLAQLGLEDRALELACVEVERQPRLPVAWIEYGRVLARFGRLREATAATATGWDLLPEGDGFDLAAPAALDLAAVCRRLGDEETARTWDRRALAACAALADRDPVRAYLYQSQTTAPPQSAPAVPITFLRLEERRLLTTQLSEAAYG
jgi:RNA polymerase sigma factor (sigma-70 family)